MTELTVHMANQARVNVTFAGSNGDLIDPVTLDASDADIRAWVTEALRTGGIPGIPTQEDVDLTNFVVDRFPPTEARPYNAVFVRPKTAFGADILVGHGVFGWDRTERVSNRYGSIKE